MPDWWGTLLVIVLILICLGYAISGIILFWNDHKRDSKRVIIIAIMSILLFPSMFTSCATINYLSEDKSCDVFNFEKTGANGGGGFETRSMRRARGIENLVHYVASAHGLVSMFIALIVSIPFYFCFQSLCTNKYNDYFEIPDYYWKIAVPLIIFSLILLGRS